MMMIDDEDDDDDDDDVDVVLCFVLFETEHRATSYREKAKEKK